MILLIHFMKIFRPILRTGCCRLVDLPALYFGAMMAAIITVEVKWTQIVSVIIQLPVVHLQRVNMWLCRD